MSEPIVADPAPAVETASWGYCLVGRADDPAGPTGNCALHPEARVVIPPTWGKRTQKWVDGQWQPAIPRPAGYVYRPKYGTREDFDLSAGPAPKPCERCGAPFTSYARGVTAPKRCPACRRRAGKAAR